MGGRQGPRRASWGLLLWLLFALGAQFLVALFSTLARYLQTTSEPPVPPMRLVVLVVLISLGTMLVFHALPSLAWASIQRQRRRAARAQAGQQQQLPLQGMPAKGQDSCSKASSGAKSAACSSIGSRGSGEGDEEACLGVAAPAEAEGARPWQAVGASLPGTPKESAGSAQGTEVEQDEDEGSTAPRLVAAPARGPTSIRAELPLRRRLSARFEQLERQRPRLYRGLALFALMAACAGGTAAQLIAPRYVAAPVVQLVSLFQVLGVPLVQWLLLGLSLPWTIWPAAALMLGGSAMYVVPSISQTDAGSLNSPSAWFGFGLSLLAMASAVTFLCVIQATRHCAFKIWVLQYLFIFSVLFTMLALSLPIEGTDWAAQLAGWGATDWCLLALLGSLVYVGSNFAIQIAILRLGAPTVALLVGARLVFTVFQSWTILGTSSLHTGTQVAGIVVTTVAVTGYVGWQWVVARQRDKNAPASVAGAQAAQQL